MKLSSLRPISLALLRELALTALLLFGVSLVAFGILNAAPGDPFRLLLEGQGLETAGAGGAEGAEAPVTWASRYLTWSGQVLRGNLGTSMRTGLPVLEEIARVMVNTLILTVGAMVITLLLAIPIALHSARRGITPLSLALTLLAYISSAIPVFWLGYLAVLISTRAFHHFPIGTGSLSAGSLGWSGFLLPVLVLGVGNGTVSEVVRYLREEMERVFSENYIRTALAKGASVWGHVFKEGFLIPITQIIATKIPFILGGAVVVEQVFNWPGMGRMAWQAAQDRDYPLIMGITLAAAVIVRLGSLAQKVAYVMVNPRASQE